MNKNADFYFKTTILNPNIQLNSGLERFVCSTCHRPQAGVIFDKKTEAGSILDKYLKIGHVCLSCKSIKDEAFAEFNQKT
jgi:hypothetical protein